MLLSKKFYSSHVKKQKRNFFWIDAKPKACNFIKKETLAQVFSCESCEISKNTFFTEHLWTTASGGLATRNISGFLFFFFALYFKDMPNSIDAYKGIFLHVIPFLSYSFVLIVCFINRTSIGYANRRGAEITGGKHVCYRV